MDAQSGWDVLTKADEVASRLRVDHLRDQDVSSLSGGERKRVALASALVQECTVVLLDEPTNFLSLAGVQWLAEALTADPKLTVLLVSHDRAFLDDVCDRIIELDQGSLVRNESMACAGYGEEGMKTHLPPLFLPLRIVRVHWQVRQLFGSQAREVGPARRRGIGRKGQVQDRTRVDAPPATDAANQSQGAHRSLL